MPRGKGCVESCTLCVHRIDRDQIPACVEACAATGHKAILFGNLNDPASEIAQRIAALAHHGAAAGPAARPRRALPGALTAMTHGRRPSRRRESRRLLGAGGAAAALVALAGLAAAHYMEEHGHIVTGMNNQIVWGLPHVFAIFLIVAASGALNVASIGSVFGQAAYKARAPLSGLLCLALLAGGLAVLMLDLGRPERMIVAATHYNFTSVFAWNVFLYSGMFAIVAVYLWTLMERRMNVHSRPASGSPPSSGASC